MAEEYEYSIVKPEQTEEYEYSVVPATPLPTEPQGPAAVVPGSRLGIPQGIQSSAPDIEKFLTNKYAREGEPYPEGTPRMSYPPMASAPVVRSKLGTTGDMDAAQTDLRPESYTTPAAIAETLGPIAAQVGTTLLTKSPGAGLAAGASTDALVRYLTAPKGTEPIKEAAKGAASYGVWGLLPAPLQKGLLSMFGKAGETLGAKALAHASSNAATGVASNLIETGNLDDAKYAALTATLMGAGADLLHKGLSSTVKDIITPEIAAVQKLHPDLGKITSVFAASDDSMRRAILQTIQQNALLNPSVKRLYLDSLMRVESALKSTGVKPVSELLSQDTLKTLGATKEVIDNISKGTEFPTAETMGIPEPTKSVPEISGVLRGGVEPSLLPHNEKLTPFEIGREALPKIIEGEKTAQKAASALYNPLAEAYSKLPGDLPTMNIQQTVNRLSEYLSDPAILPETRNKIMGTVKHVAEATGAVIPGAESSGNRLPLSKSLDLIEELSKIQRNAGGTQEVSALGRLKQAILDDVSSMDEQLGPAVQEATKTMRGQYGAAMTELNEWRSNKFGYMKTPENLGNKLVSGKQGYTAMLAKKSGVDVDKIASDYALNSYAGAMRYMEDPKQIVNTFSEAIQDPNLSPEARVKVRDSHMAWQDFANKEKNAKETMNTLLKPADMDLDNDKIQRAYSVMDAQPQELRDSTGLSVLKRILEDPKNFTAEEVVKGGVKTTMLNETAFGQALKNTPGSKYIPNGVIRTIEGAITKQTFDYATVKDVSDYLSMAYNMKDLPEHMKILGPYFQGAEPAKIRQVKQLMGAQGDQGKQVWHDLAMNQLSNVLFENGSVNPDGILEKFGARKFQPGVPQKEAMPKETMNILLSELPKESQDIIRGSVKVLRELDTWNQRSSEGAVPFFRGSASMGSTAQGWLNLPALIRMGSYSLGGAGAVGIGLQSLAGAAVGGAAGLTAAALPYLIGKAILMEPAKLRAIMNTVETAARTSIGHQVTK